MQLGGKFAISMFPVGIVGGLIIGFILFGQGKIPSEWLALIALIVAIATWFGSGADYLGFLLQWYKDKQEEKKTPVLEFRNVYAAPDMFNIEGNIVPIITYYLPIEKVHGEGFAEKCEGSITIYSAGIESRATPWEMDDQHYIDISGISNLKLFSLTADKTQILIYSARSFPGFHAEPRVYKELEDNQIKVKIYAKYGKVPTTPFVMKISDIVNELGTINNQ